MKVQDQSAHIVEQYSLPVCSRLYSAMSYGYLAWSLSQADKVPLSPRSPRGAAVVNRQDKRHC